MFLSFLLLDDEYCRFLSRGTVHCVASHCCNISWETLFLERLTETSFGLVRERQKLWLELDRPAELDQHP